MYEHKEMKPTSQVSSSQKSFTEAEIACLPNPANPYLSQLAWSDQLEVLDLLSTAVYEATGQEEFWIGLQNQKDSNVWETSSGGKLSTDITDIFVINGTVIGRCVTGQAGTGG